MSSQPDHVIDQLPATMDGDGFPKEDIKAMAVRLAKKLKIQLEAQIPIAQLEYDRVARDERHLQVELRFLKSRLDKLTEWLETMTVDEDCEKALADEVARMP